MSAPQSVVIELPSHQAQGAMAALIGTRMSTLATPMGFTFCPYGPSKPIERANFLYGCGQFYFEDAA